MTPYYSEETVYSKSDLEMENEDGVSIIYYLQKIFPGFKYNKLLKQHSDSHMMNSCFKWLQYGCYYWFVRYIVTFLDEWNNFMERLNCKKESEVWENEENILHLRHWVSLRGQTLCRTGRFLIITFRLVFHICLLLIHIVFAVRGMMYYRRALRLQAFLDMASEKG